MGKENRLGGFSLLELLMAILVISVLAAISIPTFQGYRDRAHKSVDETNLKMLAMAVKLYANDTNQLPASLDALPNRYYAHSIQAITCPSDVGDPPAGPPIGFDGAGIPTGGRSYAINSVAVAAAGSNALAWLRDPLNTNTTLIFESDNADGVGDPGLAGVAAPRHNGRWCEITVGGAIVWEPSFGIEAV